MQLAASHVPDRDDDQVWLIDPAGVGKTDQVGEGEADQEEHGESHGPAFTSPRRLGPSLLSVVQCFAGGAEPGGADVAGTEAGGGAAGAAGVAGAEGRTTFLVSSVLNSTRRFV